MAVMYTPEFFSRDISWLSFNERVLMEAGREAVPLGERIKFLSIYSSNLDEFYRVRMPALMALEKLGRKGKVEVEAAWTSAAEEAQDVIGQQQALFGNTIAALLPMLETKGVKLVYNEPLPETILPALHTYFYTQVLAFLKPIYIDGPEVDFFPANNKLYMAVILQQEGKEAQYVVVNIPSDKLSRFYPLAVDGMTYIVFLEDIIRHHLPLIFRTAAVIGAYNFKITRDAELELHDDFEEDMASKIEKQIQKRDLGFATRFLYQPPIPPVCLQILVSAFKLEKANIVAGGSYHNLKDLAGLPLHKNIEQYPAWPALQHPAATSTRSLFEAIADRDIMVHAPYQSYNLILRFFNEAAIDPGVSEIYVTLYRVADDSRIVEALISAACNGKQVTVLVELKARFDEANNIRWAREMKAAGVKIMYSDETLKVHAKIALVKRKDRFGSYYAGLLATGNLNESTARFYTDHILLTADFAMLREMEYLFHHLGQRKKNSGSGLTFQHLLVARFNLQERFLALIDREINAAKQGRPATIIIKLNNLEEKSMISKLYEASQAGVTVQLLVRSICCLIPGVPGMSDHITVHRIVDRYLEHGRVFIFHNGGQEEVYLGSADWMNRNIHRRIEVCFPVHDTVLQQEIKDIIQFQLGDTVQAVWLDSHLQNHPVTPGHVTIRSQEAIYRYLTNKAHIN